MNSDSGISALVGYGLILGAVGIGLIVATYRLAKRQVAEAALLDAERRKTINQIVAMGHGASSTVYRDVNPVLSSVGDIAQSQLERRRSSRTPSQSH